MKSDLEQLLGERGLDGLWVTGAAQNNPAMVYFTGAALITGADLLVRRGAPPVLFHHLMERDAAAATGLKTITYQRYPMQPLLREAGGDRVRAAALRAARMLAEVGLTSGRVAICGQVEIGPVWGALNALTGLLPGLELVGEGDDSVLMQARATKDPAEVERIRQVGKITLAVVDELLNYLTTRPLRGESLLDQDGSPLRMGAVKEKIELWLLERGLDVPEGTIFSIGRAAGIPHSSGDPSDPLVLGKTLLLDIFPAERRGGYFFDFTRTWCLGYAPEAVQDLYEQVEGVYSQVRARAFPGSAGGVLQDLACDLFESRGHATLRTDPQTESGYVHGLGHGVGLNIHEAPWLTGAAPGADILRVGSVVTLEPGLYYPEREMGVRLEDTLLVDETGAVPLLEYPKELVLPVPG